MREESLINDCIERFAAEPGGLLPLLHAVQEIEGYIPAAAIPAIAKALSLSQAEVHGVISFYHDFRTAPGGRHTLQLCVAEACQAVGARDLEAHALAALGMAMGETSADGQVTLEPVYCLGNCACSPSVRIDDAVYGRVDNERLDALLRQLGIAGRGAQA
ncbi:MAG: formate dehydrogenase subunit gamma [Pseudomonadota bacterium]